MKVSPFTTFYNEYFETMSASNKVITNIETAKTELEATKNTKLDELKTLFKAGTPLT